MFFSLDLDRSNISQANTDNFLGDLHLNTNDFNLGNTLFKVGSLYTTAREFPDDFCLLVVLPDRRASFSADLKACWTRCLDPESGKLIPPCVVQHRS